MATYVWTEVDSNDSSFSASYDYLDTIYNRAKERVYPQEHEYFLIAAYVVIFLLALIGNCLVCIAVLRNEHMRTVTNYYIVNLAVGDILVSLTCLPITVVVDVSETWFFGETLCAFVPYLQLVFVSVSIFTLTMIAVDRYLAICHPLKFQIRASRTVLIIALVWIVSFVVCIPMAIVHGLKPHQASVHVGKPIWLMKCMELRWQGSVWQKVYHTFFVILSYFVPLFVIGSAYMMVCRRLWSGIPTEEGCGASKPKFQNNVVTTKTISKSTEAQLKSRRKVASMLIVVVVVFAICSFPWQLMNLLSQYNAFRGLIHSHNSVHVPFLIAHLMAYFNSAVNPIIYNFMSAKFRQAFKSTFDCRSDTRKSTYPDRPTIRPSSTGACDSHTTEYLPMNSIKGSRNNNSYSVMSKGRHEAM